MTRRILIIAALAAIALAAALTSSASARTFAQAQKMCKNGSVCLFEHRNFDGKMVTLTNDAPYLDQLRFEDKASSYINDSDTARCMYETGNYDGQRFYVPSKGHGAWYDTSLGYWTDRISAVSYMRWGQRCT
jgi:Peptidase inhibitor family I36